MSVTHCPSSRPRGRPRGFDLSNALLKIRERFSQRGFAGTSIDDIVRATQLARPSLYNAFGDKRSMFLRALDGEYAELQERLRHLDPKQPCDLRVRNFLRAVLVGYVRDNEHCTFSIAFGAALADAGTDHDVQKRLNEFQTSLDAAAYGALEACDRNFAPLLSSLAVALCMRARASAASLADLNSPVNYLADYATRCMSRHLSSLAAVFCRLPSPLQNTKSRFMSLSVDRH